MLTFVVSFGMVSSGLWTLVSTRRASNCFPTWNRFSDFL